MKTNWKPIRLPESVHLRGDMLKGKAPGIKIGGITLSEEITHADIYSLGCDLIEANLPTKKPGLAVTIPGRMSTPHRKQGNAHA